MFFFSNLQELNSIKIGTKISENDIILDKKKELFLIENENGTLDGVSIFCKITNERYSSSWIVSEKIFKFYHLHHKNNLPNKADYPVFLFVNTESNENCYEYKGKFKCDYSFDETSGAKYFILIKDGLYVRFIKDFLSEIGLEELISLGILQTQKLYLNNESVDNLIKLMENKNVNYLIGPSNWYLDSNYNFFNPYSKEKKEGNLKDLERKGMVFDNQNKYLNPYSFALLSNILQTNQVKYLKKSLKGISKDEIIKNLKESLNQEKLVLVLGAGISIPYKIPKWDKILIELMQNIRNEKEDDIKNEILSVYTDVLFNDNTLFASRYFNSKLKGSKDADDLNINELIKKILYKEYSFNKKPDELLKEIYSLCLAPQKRKGIESIITYNYDSILEETFQLLTPEVDYNSIYKSGFYILPNKVNIYHVHGYLPSDSIKSDNDPVKDDENEIILSEHTCNEEYSNTYNWNNLIQLDKYINKTCLIIGSSFSDPNMRRLFDIAKKQRSHNEFRHVIIMKKPSKEEILTDLTNITNENLLNNYFDDIITLYNSNKFKLSSKCLEKINEKQKETNYNNSERIKLSRNFEDLLNRIINEKIYYTVKDLDSYGINIIWIDDFNEIPKILKNLNEL